MTKARGLPLSVLILALRSHQGRRLALGHQDWHWRASGLVIASDARRQEMFPPVARRKMKRFDLLDRKARRKYRASSLVVPLHALRKRFHRQRRSVPGGKRLGQRTPRFQSAFSGLRSLLLRRSKRETAPLRQRLEARKHPPARRADANRTCWGCAFVN